MKKGIGYRYALAGLGTALSILFITLAFYIKNLSLSFNILASVGIMLPLTKNYYKEGILSSVASSVIGFFIVNIHIISFIVACSFYIVFTIFYYNRNYNKYLGYSIKFVYSVLIFYILYKLTNLIAINFDKFPKIGSLAPIWIYLLLNLVFSIAFLVYDFIIIQVFLYLKKIVAKTLKK